MLQDQENTSPNKVAEPSRKARVSFASKAHIRLFDKSWVQEDDEEPESEIYFNVNDKVGPETMVNAC